MSGAKLKSAGVVWSWKVDSSKKGGTRRKSDAFLLMVKRARMEEVTNKKTGKAELKLVSDNEKQEGYIIQDHENIWRAYTMPQTLVGVHHHQASARNMVVMALDLIQPTKVG